MFGFEHKVILFGGAKSVCNRLSLTPIAESIFHQLGEVISPFAEVIIDIDGRNTRGRRLLFEPSDAFRCPNDWWKEFIRVVEVKSIDHVDNEQTSIRCIRDVAMEIG